MPRINKLLAELIAAGHEVPDGRIEGHSTAIALRALARAIENPGVPQHIVDHARAPGNRADEHTAMLTSDLIDKIGLRYMFVRKQPSDGRWTVTSEHIVVTP